MAAQSEQRNVLHSDRFSKIVRLGWKGYTRDTCITYFSRASVMNKNILKHQRAKKSLHKSMFTTNIRLGWKRHARDTHPNLFCPEHLRWRRKSFISPKCAEKGKIKRGKRRRREWGKKTGGNLAAGNCCWALISCFPANSKWEKKERKTGEECRLFFGVTMPLPGLRVPQKF
jgi:hypothetical protein